MKGFNTTILTAVIWFLVVSLAGLSSIYNYQRIVTVFCIPAVLLLVFFLNKLTFESARNPYSVCFLLIIFLAFFLLPIVIDFSAALENIQRLFGVYLVILITIELLSHRRYCFAESFLFAFVISFAVLACYVLFRSESQIDITASYIDRTQFDLNANTYSYFSYFSNIALFYLIHLTKRRIYLLLSLVFLLLGIYISFITVSRSGLLFTASVGIIYWGFIFNEFKVNRYLATVIMFFFIYMASTYVYELYDDSYLKRRVDHSIEFGDPRETLSEDALNVFIANPLTGVGPGQFYLYAFNHRSFSHNSYTEMAANLGILGLALLFVLLIRPLMREIIRYSRSADKTLARLNILFFSSFALINNVYVFYLTTYGMMFFFAIIVIQKRSFAFLGSHGR